MDNFQFRIFKFREICPIFKLVLKCRLFIYVSEIPKIDVYEQSPQVGFDTEDILIATWID